MRLEQKDGKHIHNVNRHDGLAAGIVIFDYIYENMSDKFFTNKEIVNVIFNDPATIVYWGDGSRTVVKCQEGDTYDKEKGLALCVMKKVYGNKGHFNDIINDWINYAESCKKSK